MRWISGSSLSRRRSTGASLMRSIRCSQLARARTSSSTASCGIAKRSPAASTISAETMASVSGILMVKVVPSPAADLMSMMPPIWSMLVFTTSMPTPRPETEVTAAAVEKPGREDELGDLRVGHPLDLGLGREPALDRLGLDRVEVEAAAVVGDLDGDVAALVIGGEADRARAPACRPRARSAGVSRPWSAELRTMWVSGSLMRSSTWRSSSVSAPCITSSICLPSSLERSRTMRGSFCQALPIGCMRVFMTPSCSSAVTWDSRCSGTLNSESSGGGRSRAAGCGSAPARTPSSSGVRACRR